MGVMPALHIAQTDDPPGPTRLASPGNSQGTVEAKQAISSVRYSHTLRYFRYIQFVFVFYKRPK
jgi:hypothetical protein